MFAEYKKIAAKGAWTFSESIELTDPGESIVPLWFASHYIVPNNIKELRLNAPNYSAADFLKLANEVAKKKFSDP